MTTTCTLSRFVRRFPLHIDHFVNESGNYLRKMAIISGKRQLSPENGSYLRKMAIISGKRQLSPKNGNYLRKVAIISGKWQLSFYNDHYSLCNDHYMNENGVLLTKTKP